MTKKFLHSFLAPMLAIGILLTTAVHANAEDTLITDPAIADGSDYTTSAAMAEKLNTIFAGDAGIYRDIACTKLVDTTLGTSPVKNNGIYMYVDPVDGMATNIGTSCWIYANGVYYTLFGEATGNGAGENSEKLDLSSTANRQISYDNFKAWGVRQGVGALVRASGHSMIVLGYDKDTLTILDGNGNGQGLVSISERSWDRYGTYVEYIIQPKEAHYTSLYACGSCGDELTWAVNEEGTLIISGSGTVTHPAWSDHNNTIEKVVIAGNGIHLGNNIFANCKNLKTIVFDGTAPMFSAQAFQGVQAQVWYPAGVQGWSGSAQHHYGGELEWIAYDMTGQKLHDHRQSIYSVQAANGCVICEKDFAQMHPVYLDTPLPTEPVATSWK